MDFIITSNVAPTLALGGFVCTATATNGAVTITEKALGKTEEVAGQRAMSRLMDKLGALV